MGVGRSFIRKYGPVPTGMLKEQLYRWAQLFSNWLATFTDSTWAYVDSAPVQHSVYEFQAVVSVLDSVGPPIRGAVTILDMLSQPLKRPYWFQLWFASTWGGAPYHATGVGTTVTTSRGRKAWTWSVANQFRKHFMVTDASGRCEFSVSFNGKTSCWVHAEISEGRLYGAPLKVQVGDSSKISTPWYFWSSVDHTSATNRVWRIAVEPRKSSDNIRFRKRCVGLFYLMNSTWNLKNLEDNRLALVSGGYPILDSTSEASVANTNPLMLVLPSAGKLVLRASSNFDESQSSYVCMGQPMGFIWRTSAMVY